MFFSHNLNCTKHVFKRKIKDVYTLHENSEFMSICGDTKWILKCSVLKRHKDPFFVLCLSAECAKEAKITAETKISFLSGDKFVKKATVVFEHHKCYWRLSRKLLTCVDKNSSVTFICEIEEVQQTSNEPFQGDPLPACSLVGDFENMLSSGIMSDVIIECKDKKLNAHRAVLAARSPEFAAMFCHDTLESQSGLIFDLDIGSEGMTALLRYIYTGGIPSTVSELAETLVAAVRYQLPRLQIACEQDLMTKITVHDAIPVLLTAQKHQLTSIKQYLMAYIKTNIHQIIETDVWEDFVRNCTDAAAELSSVKSIDDIKGFLEIPVPPCCLIEDFGAMLTSGNLADVIIECSDKVLKAHRAVLAARSPVFAAMFSHDMMESQSGRIVVPDIGSEGMSAMLNYIYTGRIPSMVSELLESLAAANKYQLPRLKIACERDLMTKITVQNAIPVLVTAEKYQIVSIKQNLLEYIKGNIHEIIETEAWVDLVRNFIYAGAEDSTVRNTVGNKDPGRRRRRDDDEPDSSVQHEAKKYCLRPRNDI